MADSINAEVVTEFVSECGRGGGAKEHQRNRHHQSLNIVCKIEHNRCNPSIASVCLEL